MLKKDTISGKVTHTYLVVFKNRII